MESKCKWKNCDYEDDADQEKTSANPGKDDDLLDAYAATDLSCKEHTNQTEKLDGGIDSLSIWYYHAGQKERKI